METITFNAAEWSEERFRAIDVHTLLPQQEPFVMVSRLVSFTPERISTELDIADSNLFVENGVLSAPGLMEAIAQTCATRIGFINKYILKRGIDIGYIGAVKHFVVKALPQAHSTLTIHVDVLEEVMGMTLAKAVVECGGVVIASTEMKIAVRQG